MLYLSLFSAVCNKLYCFEVWFGNILVVVFVLKNTFNYATSFLRTVFGNILVVLFVLQNYFNYATSILRTVFGDYFLCILWSYLLSSSKSCYQHENYSLENSLTLLIYFKWIWNNLEINQSHSFSCILLFIINNYLNGVFYLGEAICICLVFIYIRTTRLGSMKLQLV